MVQSAQCFFHKLHVRCFNFRLLSIPLPRKVIDIWWTGFLLLNIKVEPVHFQPTATMKSIILFLTCCVFGIHTNAQSVDSMMRVYAHQYPQQKVYVHFDKSVYRAGETIWFKAYLFEGYSTASISHNFYAELLNADGKVIERKVYPILEASAAGSFDIADNAPTSVVSFRGYTTWMLNFDTAFLFRKDLAIVNQKGTALQAKTLDTASTSITFFPEGGNLVAGVESVVAFKANDSKGMPTSATGTIKDSKGQTVANFKSIHNGMGSFLLTPDANETYTATWTNHRGNEQQSALPVALAEGVVLKIEIIKNRLVFRVARSDQAAETLKSLHLVAHLAQEPIYQAKVSLQESLVTSGSIGVGKLPSGVLQLTIFSSAWQPLAERIVLVNNNLHVFDANLTTPVISTAKRARNVVEIEVPDTLLSNMSLSVTDAEIGTAKHDDNILSRVLLTGDIKGYVHEPAYYFSHTTDSVAVHLDLVMMTHGWRRYKWDDVVRKRTPRVKYLPDTTLTIQARLFGLGNIPLLPTEQLLAIIVGKDSSQQVVTLPKTGPDRFSAPLFFFDTAKVFYQFQQNRNLEKSVSVLLGNNFAKRPPIIDPGQFPFVLPPTDVMTSRARQLSTELLKRGSDFNIKGNILAPVIVTTKAKSRIEQMNERYTFGMFRSDNGTAFDMTDPANASAFNIFAFLQGRVAGLQVSNPFGSDPQVTWRQENVALFLNEMRVDAQTLSTISVNDVAYVKTFRPPFFGAAGGGSGGAIAVYTKKGNDRQQEVGAGLSRANVPGYSPLKEFYSPDYSRRTSEREVTADFRTTLFWEPYDFTDRTNQKVKYEFYNNDITTSFRIVLEGVNEVGKLVRIEKVVQQ